MTRFYKSAMQQITIEVERKSLRWWSIQTDIPLDTLKKWAYGLGVKAPFSSEKMVDVLSYGTGKAENAKGATRSLGQKNLQNAERTIQWL